MATLLTSETKLAALPGRRHAHGCGQIVSDHRMHGEPQECDARRGSEAAAFEQVKHAAFFFCFVHRDGNLMQPVQPGAKVGLSVSSVSGNTCFEILEVMRNTL